MNLDRKKTINFAPPKITTIFNGKTQKTYEWQHIKYRCKGG